MTTSTAQQVQLEKPVARAVYFTEFQFKTATQYACTALQTLTWNGQDWLGLGTVSDISAVEESGGMAPRSLEFTLNISQTSILALAMGAEIEYRGLPAKMYMSPLDENFRLVGTPVRCWSGRMQTLTITGDASEGKIILTCETSAYDLRRRSGLRLNDAQHRKRYPSDPSLQYLNDLVAREQTWLSKRFQKK